MCGREGSLSSYPKDILQKYIKIFNTHVIGTAKVGEGKERDM